MSGSNVNLTCPFCANRCIEPKYGKTSCPECDATFEVDDRLECVFVDPDNVRLTVNGRVCPSCGLVQGGDTNACLYCGISINTAVQ